jgi:hypothetical protein
MTFQTVMNAKQAESVFAIVQNAYTATLTITAGTIAVGSPVVLATATASIPSTDTTKGQNFVQRPATSTSVVNNLLVGILAKTPRTAGDYLEREAIGLAQVYGSYVGAIVQTLTSTSLAGQVCIPESLQFLIPTVGPCTGQAASTSTNISTITEVPGIGGLIALIQSIASSSATSTGTAAVFIRCL